MTYGDIMARVGADKLVCVLVDGGVLHGYEWQVTEDSPLRDPETDEALVLEYITLATVVAGGRMGVG